MSKKINKLQKRILDKIDKLLEKKNKHWEIQHLSEAYKHLEDSKKNYLCQILTQIKTNRYDK